MLTLCLVTGCPAPPPGTCSNPCKDTEECVKDACQPKCAADQVRCDAICVDTQTASAHCGSCGTACKTGETCQKGKCAAAACKAPQTACGADCIDTTTDSQHCGKCNNACAAGKSCVAGSCDCPTGTSSCTAPGAESACVDTATNTAHCGQCNNACKTSQTCDAGTCTCPSGQTICGDTCEDTNTSTQHCGSCENACPAETTCVAGLCECKAGQTRCGNKCVDTNADKDNCGGCDTACKSSEECKSGQCKSTNQCNAPEQDCNGSCVDINTSTSNCGSCGNQCLAGESCDAGTCKSGCAAPKKDCNGACVDTQTDTAHCGACGNACKSGESCDAGACKAACAAPNTDCNGSCIDTNTDTAHCGACSNACKTGESCTAGTCQQVWATVLSGPANTQPRSIAVNSTGNVYTTGVRVDQDGTDNLFLTRIDQTGKATDLSIKAQVHLGFHADLNADQAISTNNWTTVKGWRTTGLTGLYNEGKAFDATTGEFTAPADGYYHFNARIQFKDADAGTSPRDIKVLLSVGGTQKVNNGTLVTLGDPGPGNIALVTEGILELKQGDKVTVLVQASKDNAYTIHTDSGFSGFYLGATLDHGFHLVKDGDLAIANNQWTIVDKWSSPTATGTFVKGSGMDQTKGVFTAPEDGLYFFSARSEFLNANLKGTTPGAQIEMFISVNDKRDSHGRYIRIASNTRDNYTLSISGLAQLTKGDTVTLAIVSEDIAYTIGKNSGFSGYKLRSDSGFSAALSSNQTVATTGWTQVRKFRSKNATSLFNNNGFNDGNDEFTAQTDGYYHFSAAAVFINAHQNDPGQYLQLVFAVNGATSLERGHAVSSHSHLTDGYGLHTNGLIYLKRGEKVTLWVYSEKDDVYQIGSATSFSGYMVHQVPLIKGIAVATDSSDNLFVTVRLAGVLDFGSQAVSSIYPSTVMAKRKSDGTWEWIKTLGRTFTPTGELKLDATGNIYMCGDFAGAWDYATGKQLSSPNQSTPFIAKFDNKGDALWALDIKTDVSFPSPKKCAIASDGATYTTGPFQGKATFDTTVLNGGATNLITHHYLTRVKPDGSGFDWVKEFTDTVVITGIASDAADNVYIVGTFDKKLTLDSTTLTSTTKELFVMALDKAGKVLWTQQTKVGSNDIRSGGIAIHGSKIIISGDFSGDLEIDMKMITRNAKFDALVASLDTTGKWLWAKSAGGAEDEFDTNVTFDDAGNYYLTSSFLSSSIKLGAITATKVQSNAANFDTLVTKNLP